MVLQLLGGEYLFLQIVPLPTKAHQRVPLIGCPSCPPLPPPLWVSKGAFLGGRGVGICSSLSRVCVPGAASSPEPTLKSVGVGDAVTLPVAVPKGQKVTNLLLRAIWREEGVAIWMDSKEISVISIHYAGRVAFLEDEMAFRIANLSLGDGDTYEISTRFTASSPQLFSSFLVAVFGKEFPCIPDK